MNLAEYSNGGLPKVGDKVIFVAPTLSGQGLYEIPEGELGVVITVGLGNYKDCINVKWLNVPRGFGRDQYYPARFRKLGPRKFCILKRK